MFYNSQTAKIPLKYAAASHNLFTTFHRVLSPPADTSHKICAITISENLWHMNFHYNVYNLIIIIIFIVDIVIVFPNFDYCVVTIHKCPQAVWYQLQLSYYHYHDLQKCPQAVWYQQLWLDSPTSSGRKIPHLTSHLIELWMLTYKINITRVIKSLTDWYC